MATVGYAEDRVYLLDYTAGRGFHAQAFREASDSIVIRFVGLSHVSTIYAYLDDGGTPRASVIEEDA